MNFRVLSCSIMAYALAVWMKPGLGVELIPLLFTNRAEICVTCNLLLGGYMVAQKPTGIVRAVLISAVAGFTVTVLLSWYAPTDTFDVYHRVQDAIGLASSLVVAALVAWYIKVRSVVGGMVFNAGVLLWDNVALLPGARKVLTTTLRTAAIFASLVSLSVSGTVIVEVLCETPASSLLFYGLQASITVLSMLLIDSYGIVYFPRGLYNWLNNLPTAQNTLHSVVLYFALSVAYVAVYVVLALPLVSMCGKTMFACAAPAVPSLLFICWCVHLAGRTVGLESAENYERYDATRLVLYGGIHPPAVSFGRAYELTRSRPYILVGNSGNEHTYELFRAWIAAHVVRGNLGIFANITYVGAERRSLLDTLAEGDIIHVIGNRVLVHLESPTERYAYRLVTLRREFFESLRHSIPHAFPTPSNRGLGDRRAGHGTVNTMLIETDDAPPPAYDTIPQSCDGCDFCDGTPERPSFGGGTRGTPRARPVQDGARDFTPVPVTLPRSVVAMPTYIGGDSIPTTDMAFQRRRIGEHDIRRVTDTAKIPSLSPPLLFPNRIAGDSPVVASLRAALNAPRVFGPGSIPLAGVEARPMIPRFDNSTMFDHVDRAANDTYHRWVTRWLTEYRSDDYVMSATDYYMSQRGPVTTNDSEDDDSDSDVSFRAQPPHVTASGSSSDSDETVWRPDE